MPNAVATPPPSSLVLGRYRPIRPLGSGGSGSVWLARDEGSGLEVALKMVPREGKAAARAEREAATAARLRHERCLRAYAFAHDDRHVYIAYEYVLGETLRQKMRTGALSDRQLVEAAAQVLDGLAHAHRCGIVHRDVKPANVLVADGEEVSAKLCDFGLAQLRDADTITATGDVPGTLAYIAPERLRGGGAGPAADVWAVGVLLWEALAERHPFMTTSPVEMAKRIEAGAPTLRQARPDLPKELVAAVDRALAPEPARRPSAERLARALRHAATQRKAASRPAMSRASEPTVRSTMAPRAEAAAYAALLAGWSAWSLPFFPQPWAPAIGLLVAAACLFRERAGLAAALAVPLLPLGNVSLGLALVYAALALAWLALSWKEPRSGLAFVLGPLLAPLGGLGLLPLLLLRVRGAARRAAGAAVAVLAAAIAAGVRGAPLPLTGAPPPPDLGLAREEHPLAVVRALSDVVAAHPSLVVEALALAAAAAVLPYALRLGAWGIAGFGAGLLAAALLPAPDVSALPVVIAVWATCAVLALRNLGSPLARAATAGAGPLRR